MENNMIAEVSVTIEASTAAVWNAITNPEKIKKYLMGTQVKSDFREGSPITYEGEYKGKRYKDKGVIKKIEQGRLFQSSYWSSMGGKEDKPENYNLVTYTLTDKDAKTVVTLSQDNIHSEKEKMQAAENWKSVLQKLKSVVEQDDSRKN